MRWNSGVELLLDPQFLGRYTIRSGIHPSFNSSPNAPKCDFSSALLPRRPPNGPCIRFHLQQIRSASHRWALSVPRVCEVDPTAAMTINVPSSLVKWLSSFGDCDPLLIHLSTDQVYEGVKSFYKEEDEGVLVNMYGKSKVVAEQFVSSNWPNYTILRSSSSMGHRPFRLLQSLFQSSGWIVSYLEAMKWISSTMSFVV